METFHIIFIIAIFLLIISALFYMQKKHVSFNKRVFLALIVGIVFGLILQFAYGPTSTIVKESANWINVVGRGFVSLLQMLVMPLVFFAILSAFTKSKLTENFGKIGGIVIGMLAFTVAISGLVGILSAGVFQLEGMEFTQGEAESSALATNEERISTLEGMSTQDKIVSMIPSNVFFDLTGARPTSVISIVVFSSILGIAYMGVRRKQPEQAKLFASIVDAVFTVVMRVVTLILRLTPYGILALMANKAATSDLIAFWNLGKFIVASYVAIFVMFLVHMLLIRIVGLNPITYMKKVLPVLTFAFSSRSSAGTLPLNVSTQKEKLGVSEGIADLSGAFGLTIGQNGCAGIYPAMLAVIVAPTVGIDPFTPSFIFTLLAAVIIGSFGVAGVGGGGIFAGLIVLSTLNLPVAIVGLLISIEPLIDMARTALNVSGSMTTGLITGKIMNQLDIDTYNTSEDK
ncbi:MULTISPECIES: L-cystine transporter [Mesobacillus]|uniref:L-cystine uptake protein TcyP n=2 Tax=Mesobacillus TaxID=2675231 RepID=A0A0D6Z7P3_9BACI|nr:MULTISPECIES: cation:dicarboxylase symporter family transporter [Mesobacillus]KIY21769.1 sodium:dicarboxylate symporter [Mesobacillus subterraneus]MDQ0412283.1 L-cystine uptake protein TcyP (sodium:dicarboxylate symporter family) [Mesobacillus stamsii]